MESLPVDAEVYRAEFFDDKSLVAFAFVVLCKERRRHIFHREIVYLNEYPVQGYDFVIEYNDFVCQCRGTNSTGLWHALIVALRESFSLDEICIRLTSRKNVQELISIAKESDLNIDVEKEDGDAFADFSLFDSWYALERGLLSSNKRSQISRSNRSYAGRYGEIVLKEADSQDEALLWFSLMGEYHTKTWNERSLPGVFSESAWVAFHERVIKVGFPKGEVQLLRVSAGDHCVGYLYNFLRERKVYNIQSGFYYEAENKYKPGILSHYLAMRYCYSKGLIEYHFLAGGESYKKSLSNESVRLQTVSLKERHFSMRLEEGLVFLVRKAKQLMRKAKLYFYSG
ncbi:MAG: GNAT family N-acetyltransferase [Cellvibrionaceae bacterium]